MTEEAKPRERHPLVWIIEAFSVLSGGAFILVAAYNGVIFALNWHLNYFALASPTDVVMSGFQFLSIWLFGWLVMWIGTTGTASWKSPFTKQVLPALSPTTRIVLTTLMTTAIFFAVPIMGHFDAESDHDRGEQKQKNLDDVYSTGLQLNPDADVSKDCQSARVLWLGSQAAVLRCHAGITVIRDVEKLSMAPRYGNSAYGVSGDFGPDQSPCPAAVAPAKAPVLPKVAG